MTLQHLSRQHQDHPVSSSTLNVGPGKLYIRAVTQVPVIKQKHNTVASWLVRLTPERAVRVRALAGDSVLCCWARHFTLTVPLSTQVYKWVPAICWGNLTKLWGSDLRWTSIPSRGSRNTSSRFMQQKPG